METTRQARFETMFREHYVVVYLPLQLRITAAAGHEKESQLVVRYLTYERRPLNSRTESLLGLSDHPGVKGEGRFDHLTGRGLRERGPDVGVASEAC